MSEEKLGLEEFCARFIKELLIHLDIQKIMAIHCAETMYNELYDGTDTPEELAKLEAQAWASDS